MDADRAGIGSPGDRGEKYDASTDVGPGADAWTPGWPGLRPGNRFGKRRRSEGAGAVHAGAFRKSLRARPQKKKPAEVRRAGITADRRAARRRRWFAVVLAAGALLAYANSFGTPFVYDDQGAIVDNPNIRQLWPLTTALTGPRQSPLAGRPIVSLSFAINQAAGGSSPLGYHAGNLGIHLLAALLLFGIVRRTLTTPALNPALLPALHPQPAVALGTPALHATDADAV